MRSILLYLLLVFITTTQSIHPRIEQRIGSHRVKRLDHNFSLQATCSPGYYGVPPSCVACSPGYYSNYMVNNTLSCTSCSVGTYTATNASTSCKNCPAGDYNSNIGATSCIPCNPGTKTNYAGMSACSPCPLGAYNPYSGSYTCYYCPGGYYSPNLGATACLRCVTESVDDTIGESYCDTNNNSFVWYMTMLYIVGAGYSWLLPCIYYFPGWRGKLTFILLTITENVAMISILPVALGSGNVYSIVYYLFITILPGLFSLCSVFFYGELYIFNCYNEDTATPVTENFGIHPMIDRETDQQSVNMHEGPDRPIEAVLNGSDRENDFVSFWNCLFAIPGAIEAILNGQCGWENDNEHDNVRFWHYIIIIPGAFLVLILCFLFFPIFVSGFFKGMCIQPVFDKVSRFLHRCFCREPELYPGQRLVVLSVLSMNMINVSQSFMSFIYLIVAKYYTTESTYVIPESITNFIFYVNVASAAKPVIMLCCNKLFDRGTDFLYYSFSLQVGSDADFNNNELHRACCRNDLSWFVSGRVQNFDVNRRNYMGKSPADLLMSHSYNPNILLMLLDHGLSRNFRYLYNLIINDDVTSLMILICGNESTQACYDRNTINEKGESILMVACSCEKFEICLSLIDKGVDIHLKSLSGDNALSFATSSNNPESRLLVVRLINSGADLENPRFQELVVKNNSEHSKSIRAKVYGNEDFIKEALVRRDYQLWFQILQNDDLPFMESIIEKYVQPEKFSFLIDRHVCRNDRDQTSFDASPRLFKFLLWHGAYMVGNRCYKSESCHIYKAVDNSNKDEVVALKVFSTKKQLEYELQVRSKLTEIDRNFIVHSIRSHEATMSAMYMHSWTKELDKYTAKSFDMLVLPYCEKDLSMAMASSSFYDPELENLDDVRNLFYQIVTAVQFIHQQGYIHADLKPKNIMYHGGSWKIIDFDSSRRIGLDCMCLKYSSAFIPPEAVYKDKSSNKYVVKKARDNDEYSPLTDNRYHENDLIADTTFDMWSLGCILFRLCNARGRYLFLPDDKDNILSFESNENEESDDSLRSLAEWNDQEKDKILRQIQDLQCRQLLSRMLCKNPKKRSKIHDIFDDDFMPHSGIKSASREDINYFQCLMLEKNYICPLMQLVLRARIVLLFLDLDVPLDIISDKVQWPSIITKGFADVLDKLSIKGAGYKTAQALKKEIDHWDITLLVGIFLTSNWKSHLFPALDSTSPPPQSQHQDQPLYVLSSDEDAKKNLVPSKVKDCIIRCRDLRNAHAHEKTTKMPSSQYYRDMNAYDEAIDDLYEDVETVVTAIKKSGKWNDDIAPTVDLLMKDAHKLKGASKIFARREEVKKTMKPKDPLMQNSAAWNYEIPKDEFLLQENVRMKEEIEREQEPEPPFSPHDNTPLHSTYVYNDEGKKGVSPAISISTASLPLSRLSHFEL